MRRPARRFGSQFIALLITLLVPVLAMAASAADEAALREGEEARVEEVVVRAVRRAAMLTDLDRPGAVRDAEQPAGVETVTDLLRGAPGAFFQQTTPGQSTPILRGLRGSQVLHLVDGMRLNHAIFRDAPNQYLALVPVEALEAVEVLPGAAPALYGADALGGVVALRSRLPEFSAAGRELGGRLTAGWSSADLAANVGVGGEVRGEDAALAVGYVDRSYGNRRLPGGDRISGSGYEAHGAWLHVRWRAAPGQELQLVGQWAEQPSTPRVDELVAGFGQDEPASERFLFRPNERAAVRLGWRWQSERRPERRLRVDVARQRIVDDRLTRDTGATATTLENNRSTLDGLVVQYEDAWDGRGRLVSGVELYGDRVDSARVELGDDGVTSVVAPRFGDGARVRSASAFLVPEWTPAGFGDGALAISAGLRLSAFEVELPATPLAPGVDLDAREVTGRLGLRWHLGPAWTVYGSYGHGFRPPNVFDLGALGPRPGNRFNVGNGGLGPETLDEVQFGLRYVRGALSVEATAFAADHDDRIRSVATGATTPGGREVVQSINGGTSRYRGAELQLRWAPAGPLQIDAVLSQVRGEDDFAGEVTPGDRIPPLHGRLRLRVRLTAAVSGALTLSGAARQDRLSARDVRDPRIDPSGTDGWLRMDARIDWRVDERIAVRGELGNLGDARYREHGSGLDAPGRYASVAVDVSF